MKERYYYLDVIRILACIMTIAMHAPLPANKTIDSDTYLSKLPFSKYIIGC